MKIWTFVGKKEGHKGHGDTPYVGDAWCFIGIERNSKLILAFEVGKRIHQAEHPAAYDWP
jgi:hypothetical protein